MALGADRQVWNYEGKAADIATRGSVITLDIILATYLQRYARGSSSLAEQIRVRVPRWLQVDSPFESDFIYRCGQSRQI